MLLVRKTVFMQSEVSRLALNDGRQVMFPACLAECAIKKQRPGGSQRDCTVPHLVLLQDLTTLVLFLKVPLLEVCDSLKGVAADGPTEGLLPSLQLLTGQYKRLGRE